MSPKPRSSTASKKIVKEFELWFKKEFLPHQEKLLRKWTKSQKHHINPYLVSYRSIAISGKKSAISIAESLLVISWLGVGLSTSFGTQFQSQLTKILRKVYGSTTSGIDVEYVDFFDKRKKYAQIKLGPDTINNDDVKTIEDKFKAIKNLAKTNSLKLQTDDLVVGVLYGSHAQLNANYKSLKSKGYEVYVGNEFFEHVTGIGDLGSQLIDTAVKVSLSVNVHKKLRSAIADLAKDSDIKNLV